jgi:hypothetical protein
VVDRVAKAKEDQFPFDIEFQKTLFRLLIEDDGFRTTMGRHIKPFYFENQVLSWAWSFCQRYQEKYGITPGFHVLLHQTKMMDPQQQALYAVILDSVRQANLRDVDWLKDQVLDFVKRNLFVRSFHECRGLYNTGDVDKAYGVMMQQMEELHRTTWETRDRSWVYGDLGIRMHKRLSRDVEEDSVPTGFPWLDHILDGGLSKGEVGNWLAYPKVGKALRDDQLVLTPTGWVPISKLQFGDLVIGGSTGKPQRVQGVFPQGVQDLYAVKLADGCEVFSSGDHFWVIQNDKLRQRRVLPNWDVVTTKDLIELRKKGRVWLPNTPCIEGTEVLPAGLGGYALGILLGDGCFRSNTVVFHKPERDLWDRLERSLPKGDSIVRFEDRDAVSIVRRHTRGKSVTAELLDDWGLLGLLSKDKFIPEIVFRCKVSVRLLVLQGLCDTDGSVLSSKCGIEFSSASYRLAKDVAALTRSLGGIAKITEKVVNGVTYWRVMVSLLGSEFPVRSDKNVAKSRKRTKNRRRHVESVVPIEAASCTCISVDDPEGLFIAEGYVVTHNTTMLIQHGRAATAIGWRKVYHAVLEGSRGLVENRYDASFMDEFYNRVKRGDIDSQKYEAARRQYELMRTLLVVEGFTDRWDYTIQDIDHALRELRVAHGWVPDLIIIDYGDLLNGRRTNYRSRLESETDAFRDIKSLANRGYALWTASQAQRPEKGAEQKADLLQTRQIAGVYDKIRICDFLGTLNQSIAEKQSGLMRLYAEMYRDNAAGQDLLVAANMAKMIIKQQDGLVAPDIEGIKDSGLGAPQQTMAVV